MVTEERPADEWRKNEKAREERERGRGEKGNREEKEELGKCQEAEKASQRRTEIYYEE